MAQKDGPSENAAEAVRAAVERLAREAERLKKLTELQALKDNPREISVDSDDLLSVIAEQQKQKEDQRHSLKPSPEPPKD